MERKKRALKVVIIIVCVVWLALGVSSFALGMKNARTHDLMAEVWADGPRQSELTHQEAQLRMLNYRSKAATARELAVQRLTIHFLIALLMWMVFYRISGRGVAAPNRS